MEKALQNKVKQYLKSKGCVVLVNSPAAGIPTGWPDVTFFYEGLHGHLEIKKSRNAKFRPLQEHWVQKLAEMSYARVVWPENWDEVRAELDDLLR